MDRTMQGGSHAAFPESQAGYTFMRCRSPRPQLTITESSHSMYKNLAEKLLSIDRLVNLKHNFVYILNCSVELVAGLEQLQLCYGVSRS